MWLLRSLIVLCCSNIHVSILPLYSLTDSVCVYEYNTSCYCCTQIVSLVSDNMNNTVILKYSILWNQFNVLALARVTNTVICRTGATTLDVDFIQPFFPQRLIGKFHFKLLKATNLTSYIDVAHGRHQEME